MYCPDFYRGFLVFSAIQRKTNGSSYIQFTSYMHGLMMGFDDVFANGQT